MVLHGELSEELLLVGRVLFGGVLAFMGVNHFLDLEGQAAYAEMKGIPQPTAAVAGSGLLLVLGGLGVVVGAFAGLASLALVVFFLVVTPVMHDFWAAPEEQADQEMAQFLKNVVILGGALVFLALSSEPWGYALNVGL